MSSSDPTQCKNSVLIAPLGQFLIDHGGWRSGATAFALIAGASLIVKTRNARGVAHEQFDPVSGALLPHAAACLAPILGR